MLPTRAAAISAAATCAAMARCSGSPNGALQELRALFEVYRGAYTRADADASTFTISDTSHATVAALLDAATGHSTLKLVAVGTVFKVADNGDTTDNGLQTAKGGAPAAGDRFIRSSSTAVAFVSAAAATLVAMDDELVPCSISEARSTIFPTFAAVLAAAASVRAFCDLGYSPAGHRQEARAVFEDYRTQMDDRLAAAETITVTGDDLVDLYSPIGQGAGIEIADLFKVGGVGDTTDNALATAKGGAVAANDVFQRTDTAEVTFIGASADLDTAQGAAITVAGADLAAFYAGNGVGVSTNEAFAVANTADTTDTAFADAKGGAPAAGDIFQKDGAASVRFVSSGAALNAAQAATAITVVDLAAADIEAFLADGSADSIDVAEVFVVAGAEDTGNTDFETAKGGAPEAGDVFVRDDVESVLFVAAVDADFADMDDILVG